MYYCFAMFLVLLMNVNLFAASFYDDFSIDTSADYINTDTYRSEGSFNISGGVLNVSCGDNNTHDVFYKDPLFEVGEYLSVSIPAGNRSTYNSYMTISTAEPVLNLF